MKRKINRLVPTFVAAFVFSMTFGIEPKVCEAQTLQTSSANQTQVYGQWDQPSASTLSGVQPASPTTDRFRNLFPDSGPKPSKNRISTLQPMQPQKPARLDLQPQRARPLQPSSHNNFIRGRFAQDADSGSQYATVNHHEASTAEAVMPLPGTQSAWNSDNIPQPDLQTQMTNWPNTHSEPASESQVSGVVGTVQTSLKNAFEGIHSEGGWGEKVAGLFGGDDNQVRKVFGSLAVVIGGYLGIVWILRKFNFSSNRGIPLEVIEVIGNAPFGPRKNLQLVRLGSKLLLLMNGPEGTHPVGEITDAAEVEHLISLCKGKKSPATRSVVDAVKQIGHRKTNQVSPNTRQTLQSMSPAPTDTFSTSQLVQALQSIQGNSPSNTVFEA